MRDLLAQTSSDVLRRTLDLLVLKTLALEAMHGWGISQRIQQMSHGVLDVNQGSLYPALQRLERNAWFDTPKSGIRRRRNYYPGTRHWRERRNFQRGARGDVTAASVCES